MESKDHDSFSCYSALMEMSFLTSIQYNNWIHFEQMIEREISKVILIPPEGDINVFTKVHV